MVCGGGVPSLFPKQNKTNIKRGAASRPSWNGVVLWWGAQVVSQQNKKNTKWEAASRPSWNGVVVLWWGAQLVSQRKKKTPSGVKCCGGAQLVSQATTKKRHTKWGGPLRGPSGTVW